MLERLAAWLVATIGGLGYPGIVALMAMESSVLPIPSELVMPPAGYLAFRGQLSPWLALVCGVAGSMIGAYANYWVAARLGRWVFVRYGKWVLLSEQSLDRTERFFARHGEVATFLGRLFPVVRHLISIPAGLARMRLTRFFTYTAAGAAIWCAVLLAVGWLIGAAGQALSREAVELYTHRAVLVMVPAAGLVLAAYVLWQRRRGRAPATHPAEAGDGG